MGSGVLRGNAVCRQLVRKCDGPGYTLTIDAWVLCGRKLHLYWFTLQELYDAAIILTNTPLLWSESQFGVSTSIKRAEYLDDEVLRSLALQSING